MFDSVVEAIVHHAKFRGKEAAIIADCVSISYEELWLKIQQYATALSEKGVESGDKVILSANSTEQFVEIYFAVHWLGAVNVVVDKTASIKSVSQLIRDILPKLVILNQAEEGAESYETFSVSGQTVSKGSFSSNSLADILFTTGTTGIPKGVMLSHRNEVAGALNVIIGGEMTQHDVNLLTMPLHHAFGLTTLRAVLYKGGTAILQDGVASLKKMSENIKKNHCNVVYMVPAALRVLYFQTRQRLDLLLGNVEKLEFCTAPLDKKMRIVLSEQLKGVRLYNSYGSTESARSVYMRLDRNTDKLDAIGQAVEGVFINIVDDNHQVIVSSRQNIGHLAICGAMNMIGYYNDTELTETVLSEGIFYSEDLGYMDEDGYIYLAGRNNDVINIGGEKVSPLEIENVALNCRGVRECACIGIKDPKDVLGHVPILFVVSDIGGVFCDNIIQSYMEEHLESYKVPYKIVEVDDIPKNHIGKINRKKLQDLWQSYLQK